MEVQVFAAETPMTFTGGRAAFFSRAAEQVCWPIGAPKVVIVDGERMTSAAAPAFFNQHRWSTELKEYAAGMVKNGLFGLDDGWVLDPSCLPKEIIEVWPGLSIKSKRAVCLSMISGVEPKDALKSLPADEVKVKPKTIAEDVPAEITCPVPGCGLSVVGEVDPDRARAALMVHQRTMHPDWLS